MSKEPGRAISLYLDDETYRKLEALSFGNSRSDKIRYCIRQMDPTMGVHHEALLIFNAAVKKFLKEKDLWDEFDKFQWSDN
jgi:hypothetical protein